MKTTQYVNVKGKVAAGESVNELEWQSAISEQLRNIVVYADSLARHAANVMAAEHHPFPLPHDEEGRVGRRAVAVTAAQARLTKLYFWREVERNKLNTAQGVGSA